MEENINRNTLIITYKPIPNEENIEYAFQRLVLPIIIATGFKPYEESHKEFKKILNKVISWIILYSNTKDLSQINLDEFIDIRQQLFELDSKYLPIEGYYAEEAYEWVIQLQILLEKSIKERKVQKIRKNS